MFQSLGFSKVADGYFLVYSTDSTLRSQDKSRSIKTSSKRDNSNDIDDVSRHLVSNTNGASGEVNILEDCGIDSCVDSYIGSDVIYDDKIIHKVTNRGSAENRVENVRQFIDEHHHTQPLKLRRIRIETAVEIDNVWNVPA